MRRGFVFKQPVFVSVFIWELFFMYFLRMSVVHILVIFAITMFFMIRSRGVYQPDDSPKRTDEVTFEYPDDVTFRLKFDPESSSYIRVNL